MGRDSKRAAPLRAQALRDPFNFVALGFGVGLAPRAPGTFGSLLALLPGWYMLELPFAGRCALVAACILIGIWICDVSARRLGVDDHPGIVFDEIAGMLLTLLAVPPDALWAIPVAFVLFRIFDIAKPWPIRDIDHRLHGGVGIMLDDLIAGIFAAACLGIIQLLLPITPFI